MVTLHASGVFLLGCTVGVPTQGCCGTNCVWVGGGLGTLCGSGAFSLGCVLGYHHLGTVYTGGCLQKAGHLCHFQLHEYELQMCVGVRGPVANTDTVLAPRFTS